MTTHHKKMHHPHHLPVTLEMVSFYNIYEAIKILIFESFKWILNLFLLFSVSLLSGTDELQSSLLGAEQACGAFINQLDSVLKLLG
jgi:hypothetical protein